LEIPRAYLKSAGRTMLFAAAATIGASQLLAQAPPAATPTLTANARLVVLDVDAVDQTGKVPADLTAKDFQVFEDGKPQRIRSVEPPSAHTLPMLAPSAAPSKDTVFDPAHPAAFGQSPVTILVLDQLNTHFADSSFARRSLRDYLAAQPAVLAQPATLLSVYDEHFKLLQPFTRDRDALLRALAAAPVQYAWQLEINGKADHGPIERLDQSLRALEEIAQNDARIPGRKNLIWVGGGFPSMDPAALEARDLQEVQSTLRHVTDVLLAARVTLFAVDPTSTAAAMTEVTDASQMAFMEAAGDSDAGGDDPFGASDDFDRLGPVTGGRVIRARNDVAAQIAASVELGANFYTIAYTPDTDSGASAKYRKIKVVCLRPGVTATTRTGYYGGQTPPRESEANAAYDLTAAAESARPLNGLHVTVERDASPQAPPETWIVHVSAPNLTWKPESGGAASASVYVMAVSLDAKNKMLSHTLQGMTASARPGANLIDETRTAEFVITAPAAPKAAMLRFVVRDNASGRIGSVDLPLPKR